jgi:hypothetical protein
MFLFRKSKLVLDLVISEENIQTYNLFPAIETRRIIPSWFKTCPKSEFNWFKFIPDRTVKSCPGIIDYINSGFVTPLWSDVNIRTSPEQIEWYSAKEDPNFFQYHETLIQSPGFYNNQFMLKTINPWRIKKRKQDIKIISVFAQYHHSKSLPYSFMQGTLDTKMTTALNFFIAFPKTNATYELKAGDIFMQYIPLSDKQLVIKNHLVSKQEFINLSNEHNAISFYMTGMKIKNILKSKEKNSGS